MDDCVGKTLAQCPHERLGSVGLQQAARGQKTSSEQ